MRKLKPYFSIIRIISDAIEDFSANDILELNNLGLGERRLSKKIVSKIMLTLLLTSMVTLAIRIQPVKASGTIYIRADGSIDPPDARISTVDYVTYTLTGSITSDADGIVVERSNIIIYGADYTVEGTGFSPYKGIYLSGIANVTIKNTRVKHFYYGIGLYSSSSNSIVGSEITNNSYSGIGLFGFSGNNNISGNNITSNGPAPGTYGGVGWAGIELSSSSGRNSISGNNITNNPSGIHLVSTSYNNIYGNDLLINGYGISIVSSSHNIIYRNNIASSDNLAGILFQWSSYNNIYGNNISNNKEGIDLGSSYSNNIYHNNFINNTRQITTYTTPTYMNTWDNGYPSGGNYWSDYNGMDEKSGPYQDQLGSDGIGDWPYVIDGDNRDLYPLMSPSPPPPPMFVTETIHIRADGSVDPPTAPIQRDREIYSLTRHVIAYADGIQIERSDIVIDGAGCWLWGNGSGSGFSLDSLNNVTIKNIRIEDFYVGVYLDLSSLIVLLENRMINNGGSGIMIENSDHITLTGNAVTHNALDFGPSRFAGIMLVNTTNSQITNNNVTGNANGLYLYRSSDSIIFGNIMKNNQWQGSILLEWSSNNIISRNDVREGPSGIVVKGSSNDNIISENNVSNNMFHGIRLLDSSNNTLSQNIMNGNDYGGFSVEGRILSHFIHFIDASNLVDEKPIHYLLNLNDVVIDPVTHPEIGYLAIINCTNITAEGLNLTSKWQGLLLAYTEDSRITNNNVTNNLWCGIQIIVSNNNTISRNNITNNDGAGIKIFYSSNDNTISENNVTNNKENGIELYESSNNLISGNNVTNNDQYGVVQFYSNNNTISRNNMEDEKGGIAIASSSNNTVSENNITNNEQGVWLHDSSINKLRNNHMGGNRWSFGVDGGTLEHFMHDVDASNTVDGKPICYWVNRQGETVPAEAGYVALVNSTNVTVQNLNLKNNIQGLLLACTENSTIKNNNITNNYDGIDLVYSSNSSISDNNIKNNSRYGVCLLHSSDNKIFVNNMEKNMYSIVAVYSSHNTMFGNNIKNGWLGIYLEGSSNNRIFHNNFINNTRQAYSYSMNIWDDGHPSGGNYWSDHTGEDLYGGPYQNITGSDGIGDTPYVIDANNQDRYPLMSPYVLLGDLNNDGVVNTLDMAIFGKAYGSYPGHPRWNPAADLDGNGIINILDGVTIAKNFGKKLQEDHLQGFNGNHMGPSPNQNPSPALGLFFDKLFRVEEKG